MSSQNGDPPPVNGDPGDASSSAGSSSDNNTPTSSSTSQQISTSTPPPTTQTPPPPPPTTSTPTRKTPTSIPPSSILPSSITPSPPPSTSTVIVNPASPNNPTTVVISSTINVTPNNGQSSSTASETNAAATSAGATVSPASNSSAHHGLTTGTKVAIGVVVPIVALVLLGLLGLWFWRKRKDRKDNEDMRRKEMEEYGYNPNNDPLLPTAAGAQVGSDEASRERDAGYRGWGTTSATTRQASTTMSSNPGMARSEAASGAGVGGVSDGHSGDPLVGNGGAHDDAVGALGAAPAVNNNRNAGVARGISNASSAYSATQQSDVSGEHGGYQNEYLYQDENAAHGAYGDGYGQPVIRDVSARRNTRIENPSIIPHQGNSGIAQNF